MEGDDTSDYLKAAAGVLVLEHDTVRRRLDTSRGDPDGKSPPPANVSHLLIGMGVWSKSQGVSSPVGKGVGLGDGDPMGHCCVIGEKIATAAVDHMNATDGPSPKSSRRSPNRCRTVRKNVVDPARGPPYSATLPPSRGRSR